MHTCTVEVPSYQLREMVLGKVYSAASPAGTVPVDQVAEPRLACIGSTELASHLAQIAGRLHLEPTKGGRS